MLKEIIAGFTLSTTISHVADDLRKIETYHTIPTSVALTYDYEDRREDTNALEDILVGKSYLKEADECFDANTEAGLKSLQKDLDVKATGKLDKATRERLNSLYDHDFNLDLKREMCRIDADRKLILDVSENLETLHYLHGHSDHLTPEVIEAVELYKRLNTITNSTTLSKEFLMHLNLPPTERVRRLEKVLGEFKKLETGKPTVFANIPEYRLYVLKDDAVVYTLDIAVGEPLRKWNTDVQTGAITSVRINPTWFVPSSILPEVRHDKRLKYVSGRYIFESGPENPLGRIAFPIGTGSGELFHDTPGKGVFTKNKRAVSHGCMRLSDARSLFLKFKELGWIDPSVNLDFYIEKKEKDKYVGSDIKTSRIEVKVRYLLANAMLTKEGVVAFFPNDVYKKGY